MLTVLFHNHRNSALAGGPRYVLFPVGGEVSMWINHGVSAGLVLDIVIFGPLLIPLISKILFAELKKAKDEAARPQFSLADQA